MYEDIKNSRDNALLSEQLVSKIVEEIYCSSLDDFKNVDVLEEFMSSSSDKMIDILQIPEELRRKVVY